MQAMHVASAQIGENSSAAADSFFFVLFFFDLTT